MKTPVITFVILFICFAAVAEPEIKGTAAELARCLNNVLQTVVVTGEAEVRVPAQRAVLSLRVVTESRSLQEAMRSNQEIRGKVAEYVKAQGISTDRIQSAKFSSTPKFGMFSEKARSYRVENEMRISVQDEKEFQAAVSSVDKWSEVQFGNVEFEYADKEAQKQNAVGRACDNANDRKKIYEEKLGLKLVAAKFDENRVEQRYASLANTHNPALSTYTGVSTSPNYGAAVASPDGVVGAFGEIVYSARVMVEYAVRK